METKEMPEKGYKMIARVVSQKGTCGFGYKVGDEVVFDGETIQGRICLSALYSFLPKGLCHEVRRYISVAQREQRCG